MQHVYFNITFWLKYKLIYFMFRSDDSNNHSKPSGAESERNNSDLIKKTGSKKRMGLKDRQDVVNKSLIRGMKKFFSQEIKKHCKLKRVSNKK